MVNMMVSWIQQAALRMLLSLLPKLHQQFHCVVVLSFGSVPDGINSLGVPHVEIELRVMQDTPQEGKFTVNGSYV